MNIASVGETSTVDSGSLIGKSTMEFVAALHEIFPRVVKFSFNHYLPSPGIVRRIDPRGEIQEMPELDWLKANNPMIFSQVITCFQYLQGSGSQAEGVFEEMLRHDNKREEAQEFWVAATDLERDGLSQFRSVLQPGEALALCSRCSLSSEEIAHIPMLDFQVPPNETNLRLVIGAARALGLSPAVIADSGRSYHLYGLALLSGEVWQQIMYKALLITPVIDIRYVAHRLLAGRGVLRVNEARSKPKAPQLVATVD